MTPPSTATEIHYPSSDGKPMAESIEQLRWITLLYGNLEAVFRDRPDVFVGGDQLWYPVEGHPEIRLAPDVYVIFDRSKGDRRSYKQWEEDDIPMTVVFEILSQSNTPQEMTDKFLFYEQYGVEEYYIYNPDTNKLEVYTRGQITLRRVEPVDGFVSPRLKIRFQMTSPEMTVFAPDGEPFKPLDQIKEERNRACRDRDAIQRDRDAIQRDRDAIQQRLARLVDLSRKVRRGEATTEELRELEQLEEQVPPS